MYDDVSDKDSEMEERSPTDSPNVTKKSLSTMGFRSKENQTARPLGLRATQSLTGAVEELRLTQAGVRVPGRGLGRAACPCGCLLRPAPAGPFRTREKDSLALHVVPAEVLNYHGYNFEPTQIAMFWKKDCRMFLWKGKAKLRNSKNESNIKIV